MLARTALAKVASGASHAVDDVARATENVVDDAAKLAVKKAAWLKICGVTGGVVGYIGGDKAAGTIASWTMNAIHATGTTITGVACAIGNGTCVAASAVKDGVCVAAVAVKDGVCVAASAVKVGACAVGNGTCAASRSVARCVKRTWNWAWGY